MAFLMTASGSLAHRQILHDISSQLTARFTTRFTKNDTWISPYNISISVKIAHGLLLKNVVWLSWKYILNYAAALMALSTEKVPDAWCRRSKYLKN